LTSMLNELSRSMGQPDYYPFVLPRAAVGKLQFIHGVVTAQRSGTAPTMVTAGDVAEAATEAAEPAQGQTQSQSQGDVAQS
ncbi:MAG: putative zinc-binding metallopeptidase, partial [Hydrogenophaga sp.]|nr:putative zinc-binding metallopeptidase [Hydrogenophaga sp.]